MTVSSKTQPVPLIRRAKTLAAIATFATAMIATFAVSPALAVPLQVRQGETITIVPDCLETEFTVNPTIAGNTSVINTVLPTGCRIDFTASSTYSGPVTVSSAIDTVELIVVGTAANARGSFTPIAAPGPCIVITANSVVSFGDVTLGGDYQQGDVAPTLAGCAPPSVTQDVRLAVSEATNGQSTLLPLAIGCPVLSCPPPAAGFYSVRASTSAVPDLDLADVPRIALPSQAGDFSNQSTNLFVRVPSSLEPASVGTLFTFNVNFVALIA